MTRRGRQRGSPRREGAPPGSPPRDEFLARVFAQVKPLAPGPRLVKRAEPPKAARPPSVSTARQSSRQFVLERDGDELEGHASELGPGALADLRSARWRPDCEIDLHGRRAAGLERSIARELIELASRGKRRLLVIHGKGLHSAGGVAVLRDALVDALTGGPAAGVVRAFRSAPLRLGGTGALAVELEGPRRSERRR
jgi:DNA-nicking Smr family endonuclease